MKKSYYLFVTLALTLILVLAACGSSQTTTTDGSGSGSTGDTPVLVGDAVNGKAEYDKICIACHGPDGVGIENLGKDMTSSEFIADKTDVELVEFIKTGRPASDPLNTTGVDMPPKGGNPALTDQQLFDIVAYIRTIHK